MTKQRAEQAGLLAIEAVKEVQARLGKAHGVEHARLKQELQVRLQELAEAERIVFVGDQREHLSIEAGAPVRQFLADNLAMARLTTIRRQQDPELRRAVTRAADGYIPEAVDLLIKQNRIIAVKDTAERYEHIATEYLQGHEAGENVLVVSPGNDERRALNQAIRSKLVEHGYVATLGQQHQILIRRDMTPAQIQHVSSSISTASGISTWSTTGSSMFRSAARAWTRASIPRASKACGAPSAGPKRRNSRSASRKSSARQ
jgi:hypothetical protein